jgi:hypothetical protein
LGVTTARHGIDEGGNMNHVRRRQFLLAAVALLLAPIHAKAQKA